VQREALLATVGITGAAAFFSGGGFLVYAGNHDEQRADFSADERNAAGIEVQGGIALLMMGAVALVVGGRYLEVLHDERAHAASSSK